MIQASEQCPRESLPLLPSSALVGVGLTLKQELPTSRPAPHIAYQMSNPVERKHFFTNRSFTIPREDSQWTAQVTCPTTANSTSQKITAVPRSQGEVCPSQSHGLRAEECVLQRKIRMEKNERRMADRQKQWMSLKTAVTPMV